jgi:hypothetical protein
VNERKGMMTMTKSQPSFRKIKSFSPSAPEREEFLFGRKKRSLPPLPVLP